MRKVLILGPLKNGKTTLIQALKDEEIRYKKTQDIIYHNNFIDTPGEFMQHRNFNTALQSSSQQSSLIIFLLSATTKNPFFSPGYAYSFSKKVVGVVTHIDVAPDEAIKRASKELNEAGAKRIFKVSSVTKEGMQDLKLFLKKENIL